MSEVAQAVARIKGAKKIKQERPAKGDPPARTAKLVGTGQRARLVKIEQKFDQVQEDAMQFGKYKEEPCLSSFLPAVLVQAAEKHTFEVDVALAELPLVLTEGGFGISNA